jgi:tRNA (guanine10-N2)-methyltransferase
MLHTFGRKRSDAARVDIIQSFAYLCFAGPIRLNDADETFAILEEYVSSHEIVQESKTSQRKPSYGDTGEPRRIFFGRLLARSSRDMVSRYSLKQRDYISTTSMDAELSLVTANMALAAPGKLVFDPFVGTGSFCVAAAHFGALTLGADIDPRSFRGREDVARKTKRTGLESNFYQYGLQGYFWDVFTSDLTNTPLRRSSFLDVIMCDPPYGVREGLKVLGTRDGKPQPVRIIDGEPTYKYIWTLFSLP